MSARGLKIFRFALQAIFHAPVIAASYAFGATLALKPVSDLWLAIGAIVALLFTAANVCFSMGRNVAEEKLRLDRAGSCFFLAALLTVETVAIQFLIERSQAFPSTAVLLVLFRSIKVIVGMFAIGSLLTGVNLAHQTLWTGVVAHLPQASVPARKP